MTGENQLELGLCIRDMRQRHATLGRSSLCRSLDLENQSIIKQKNVEEQILFNFIFSSH